MPSEPTRSALEVIESSGSVDAIKLLEDLLEAARTEGEVRCVAVAMIYADGAQATGWSKPPPLGDYSRLMGAVSYLSWRLCHVNDQGHTFPGG